MNLRMLQVACHRQRVARSLYIKGLGSLLLRVPLCFIDGTIRKPECFSCCFIKHIWESNIYVKMSSAHVYSLICVIITYIFCAESFYIYKIFYFQHHVTSSIYTIGLEDNKNVPSSFVRCSLRHRNQRLHRLF